MLMFELAVPPSGEVAVTCFGGVHQKPVEFPPVLLGLTTPALFTKKSRVQLPLTSTGAVPMNAPAALPLQTPDTL